MSEPRTADERPEVVVEITVKPRTFRVREDAETWDAMTHDERSKWCQEIATEMDKVHFDYVFVGPYHG